MACLSLAQTGLRPEACSLCFRPLRPRTPVALHKDRKDSRYGSERKGEQGQAVMTLCGACPTSGSWRNEARGKMRFASTFPPLKQEETKFPVFGREARSVALPMTEDVSSLLVERRDEERREVSSFHGSKKWKQSRRSRIMSYLFFIPFAQQPVHDHYLKGQ